MLECDQKIVLPDRHKGISDLYSFHNYRLESIFKYLLLKTKSSIFYRNPLSLQVTVSVAINIIQTFFLL